jgi:alginate O-acetyltransferase complex protein AlgI
MLFNSYQYILLFLPISLIIYFILNHYRLINISKLWLVFVSLFFYGYWNLIYIPLLLCTIFFNYTIGNILFKIQFNKFHKKVILIVGLISNISLLGFFKYTDFLISIINNFKNIPVDFLQIILPLGISFFTFTQIAYLVDVYRGFVKEYKMINFVLFVTFFPHLLAGPIIHHKEMMPQFDRLKNKIPNYKNLAGGLLLIIIGLFKKVIIADTFATYANAGFNSPYSIHFLQAWISSLSYTLQLYFDFSGYTDIAIGSSLMFNIVLPINFNSPYRALDIQDFWRRWHITLSRFLRDYIYIPLGGNRLSESRTLVNLIVTFLIGGLWHGAGWTFIFWGFLHGLAMVIHRIWQKSGIILPNLLAWFLTFQFVNAAWVFFRADSFTTALNIFKGMCGLNGFKLPSALSSLNNFGFTWDIYQGNFIRASLIITAGIILAIIGKNSNEMENQFSPNFASLSFSVILLSISIFFMAKSESEFIYFNF